MSLGWVGAEGINVINFQGQQGSEALAYCEKEWPYCVNNPTQCTFITICNICVEFLPKSVKGCCQQSPPTSCFQNVFEGNSGAAQNEQVSLSAAPNASPSITDANALVCATALAAVSACEGATSGFDSLDATSQASCLCYDTANNYVPSAFDNAWSSCAAYASTADSSDYPVVTSALGLCQNAGDVRGGVNSPATTTDGSSAASTATAATAPATGTPESTTGSSNAVQSSPTPSASGSSSSSTGSSAASTSRFDVRLSGVLVIGILFGALLL